MNGRVILVVEHLERVECVRVDLHHLLEGEALDVSDLQTPDAFILQLADGVSSDEMVK